MLRSLLFSLPQSDWLWRRKYGVKDDKSYFVPDVWGDITSWILKSSSALYAHMLWWTRWPRKDGNNNKREEGRWVEWQQLLFPSSCDAASRAAAPHLILFFDVSWLKMWIRDLELRDSTTKLGAACFSETQPLSCYLLEAAWEWLLLKNTSGLRCWTQSAKQKGKDYVCSSHESNRQLHSWFLISDEARWRGSLLHWLWEGEQ